MKKYLGLGLLVLALLNDAGASSENPFPPGIRVWGNVSPATCINCPRLEAIACAPKGMSSRGVGIAEIWINAEGAVDHVRVLKPAPTVRQKGDPDETDDPLVRLLRTWSFRPAAVNGTPTGSVLNVTVNSLCPKKSEPKQ